MEFVTQAAMSDIDECIEITGWVGRPTVAIEGRKHFASRVAWEIRNGPVPPGKNVCHTCDNGFCVNGSHLYAGTQSQNVKDSYERGRRQNVNQVRGERVGTSKLTEQNVREIRRRYTGARGELTQLGKEFGVTKQMIALIVKGKWWA